MVISGVPVTEDLDHDYLFPSEDHPEPSVGGCIVVSRKAFDYVKGYDDRFIGWGEEDRAFEMSLATLVHPAIRLAGPIYHLWHPWKEEECFGQPNFMDNRLLCNRYREAINNPDLMGSLIDER
jgi:predicted glycosyltransferase involved in capsule biosynthesis